jgi:hypothetical protein
MFDNTNFPWINSMSTDIPTVGDMLRQAASTPLTRVSGTPPQFMLTPIPRKQ